MAIGMIDVFPAVVIEVGEASSPANQQPIGLSQLRFESYIFPNQVALIVVESAVVAGKMG